LGSTLRTALAFGVRDVVLVGGIDPWSPHVVRAAIGAAFALRLSVIDGLGHLANGEEGATTWYLDARGATTVRDAAPLDEPWTLVVGPEWPGLADGVVDRTRTIRIDHEADVESLNVTVAVGIALHGLVGR
jgi:TrmH family RNA methyltransferase